MKSIYNPYSKVISNAAQFVIPVFPRDYSWTETDCEQLIQNVLHDGPVNIAIERVSDKEFSRLSVERGDLSLLGEVQYG